jgi:hypothetical protein
MTYCLDNDKFTDCYKSMVRPTGYEHHNFDAPFHITHKGNVKAFIRGTTVDSDGEVCKSNAIIEHNWLYNTQIIRIKI